MTEAVIDKILALNHGIYGREQCDHCGLMENYVGQASAIATHPRRNLFICHPCLKPWAQKEGSVTQPEATNEATDVRTSRRTYLLWYATTHGESALLTLYENTLKTTTKISVTYA